VADRLPDDIVRLVTHVELNQSGWWDRALDRLVLSVVASGSTNRPSVETRLKPLLRDDLAKDRVRKSVERLLAGGELVEVVGSLKASEVTSRQLGQLRDSALEDERTLQDRFVADCVRVGLDVDPSQAWQDANDLFLDVVVGTHGARLYELITARSAGHDAYSDVIAPLETRYGTPIREVLLQLVDSSDPTSRRYLLRKLNAELLRDAAALPVSTIEALRRSGARGTSNVFLDSNFVFSILGLHDDEGRDLARNLLSIAEKCRSDVPTKFFVAHHD
jgi:hypothetical protein